MILFSAGSYAAIRSYGHCNFNPRHVLTSAGRITTCSLPPPAQQPVPVAVPPVAATPAAASSLPSSAESVKSAASSSGSAGPEPAAGTPAETQPPKPPKGKANAKRQKVEPTTPLEKGRDLKDKLLKKVTSTTTLETQLTSVPYADKLLEEIRADLATFRCFGSILTCRVRFGCFAPPTL